ncbi:uncharacterized protein EDB91DRAFT_899684 [Suillus paluster]|uniref:uncharacterized protein n=1 Tax=Suillus paluster TaxID=48578 RepID=UPI001B876603|nr:uncharacterized protein EDB91DRAFT_899684 [Suillus paluster]KAG1726975.1 hypothetical protein EDB91DRAFT_899684 [Suillus paluster]
MSQLIPSTTPLRVFKDHTNAIWGVAVSPDRRRMVTCSFDKTLRLWDLRTGVVLKKMEGHHGSVYGLGVSRDGQMIASADLNGELIAWHGETGEPLIQAIKAHSHRILSLEFSPDGTVLVTGSEDKTTKLWNTKTWEMQGSPMRCSGGVWCTRYSPSGELLAIATVNDIEIYNSDASKRVAHFKGHTGRNFALAWTPDGKRLLSGGDEMDPTIREWDTSTWTQVGSPCQASHDNHVYNIAIHPTGTHVASVSHDHVRLCRLSDRETIATFKHSGWAACVTFSTDGRHILSGGGDNMISQWETPKGVNLEILSVNTTTARDACIAGDLSSAEILFTQEIDADAKNYTSYANRSFVMARKHDWDHALDDAIKSITIQPSLTGYISKGIALCGKGQVRDARTAFDVASIFTNEDLKTVHFLFLVKAIALFGANKHQEAMQLVQQLAAACPNHDALAYRVVEAYLCVQLGVDASNGSRHDEAANHFAAAIHSGAFSSGSVIHFVYYDDLVVLFGLDLESLWQIANQKRCDALVRAGRIREALESHQLMMDMCDEATKASCLDWSTVFTQECSMLCLANGDTALAASDYDTAIELYSVVIDMDSANDVIFANRSKAKLEKRLWDDALLDAQKVIELNPSSHVGYEVKHTALHRTQRYDEAIEAFEMMISKLESATDTQIQKLREQYINPSEAAAVIQKAIHVQLNIIPLRLLNTATGLLCDREAQISAFKTRTEYKELLSSTMKHPELRAEHITEAVAAYFRCVMLSHKWDEKEPLLPDIKGKVVYELEAAGSLVKLQSFCDMARKADYHWAWVDSCCIDQHNNIEVQKSLNSMFGWYHDSALTAVYLSDVLPLSKSGALAKSAWNTRGWTVPEFLAPKVIRFYQQDWTPYLDDHSHNHKESEKIMGELERATGIDARALVAFQPGMRDAREKLRWASTRVTTVPEDIAYSLFGIFGVQLPILYGENKQNALGRLLQEIIAQSGDITALDWVGQPSTFNSCLPADISSYNAPPFHVPSLSEDEIESSVSSLRSAVAPESASRLYQTLDHLSASRFAHRRLHLSCIVFPVTEAKWRSRDQAYRVKAHGLQDLQITTTQLNPVSRTKPSQQTFLLVRPWDRRLLELPNFTEQSAFADNAESLGDLSDPESPLDDSDESPCSSSGEEELVNSESHLRALRLMVRLGQPFSAFLLARQPGGEYQRIASDRNISAQVKDGASIHSMMDVRTVEIL